MSDETIRISYPPPYQDVHYEMSRAEYEALTAMPATGPGWRDLQ